MNNQKFMFYISVLVAKPDPHTVKFAIIATDVNSSIELAGKYGTDQQYSSGPFILNKDWY